jgi:predicted Zn-dependent peptidase
VSAHDELDRTRPPAPGALRPFHFPPVQRATLSSGLQVLLAENHTFPLATLDLVLPAGGLSEPEGKGGVSSLTSGLLESGAGARDAAEVAERVDELGLVLENGNSWDTTLVGFTGLNTRLDAGMEVLADLAIRPTFPADEVERIRNERLAGLTQRRNDPGALADELVTHFIFPDAHPFSRRMGGLACTLAILAREDVTAFHDAHYRPGGAWLCAAGDLTLDEVVRLAERHFAGWTGSVPAPAEPQATNRLQQTTILLADRPGSVQSEVRVGHIGVPRNHPDYFAITVLNAILGGTFSSRLNLNLREKLGYTYGASSSFGMRRAPGTFHVSSAIQSEPTPHAVSEILRDMREVQQDLVPREDLENAQNYLAGVFPLGLQTTDGLSGKLSTLAVYGLPDDYFGHYRERLLAVTREEVREAARTHLMPDRAAIVIVGDAGALRPGLEALNAGPVQIVDPATELR